MATKKITINTGNGQAESTISLKGDLNAIILNAPEKVSVTITSELGYVIMHKPDFKGIEYLAIRARARPNDEKLTDKLLPECMYNLDEQVSIRVMGQSNVDVSMIIKLK